MGTVHSWEERPKEEFMQVLEAGPGHVGREFWGLGELQRGLGMGRGYRWAHPLGPPDSLPCGQQHWPLEGQRKTLQSRDSRQGGPGSWSQRVILCVCANLERHGDLEI